MVSVLTALKLIWDNKTALVFATLLGVLGIFYLYYSHTNSKISTLISENTSLQITVNQKDEYISSLKKDYQTIVDSKDRLAKAFAVTNAKVDELRSKLNREESGKKPLSELAVKKRTLVERRVNRSAAEVLLCFEKISRGEDCP